MLRYLFVPGNNHFLVACVLRREQREWKARMEGAGLGERKNIFNKNPLLFTSAFASEHKICQAVSKKYQDTWICLYQSMQKLKFRFAINFT